MRGQDIALWRTFGKAMKISARTRYGLRILIDIAQHEADETPRSIGAISKSQGITSAFISRLAVPLKRAGLIRALRGIGGGLRLAKSPDDITILEIMEALDGPVSILKCLAKPKSCRRASGCPARTVWADLNTTIRDAFASTTLAKVMSRIGATDTSGDYCI